jgi:hypothetical protein
MRVTTEQLVDTRPELQLLLNSSTDSIGLGIVCLVIGYAGKTPSEMRY